MFRSAAIEGGPSSRRGELFEIEPCLDVGSILGAGGATCAGVDAPLPMLPGDATWKSVRIAISLEPRGLPSSVDAPRTSLLDDVELVLVAAGPLGTFAGRLAIEFFLDEGGLGIERLLGFAY